MNVNADTATLERYVPRMLLGRLARPADELVETLEGTMVFADVSGFTRLSERLARRGTEGAEHLVDAINLCFSALLAEAYGRGGSLVKFGGDAMLLWFWGDGHALRACDSASAMRRTLRDVGRIRAGAERRGASDVGGRTHGGVRDVPRRRIASRAGDRGLVDRHRGRDGGPGLRGADPREPPNRRGASAHAAWAGRFGSGILLARAPGAPEWAPDEDVAQPAADAIANCLPALVRAHLLGGHAAPEHRTASIAFLQFTGLDRLIDGDGADAASRALDEFVRAVGEACDRYEVCFLDSDISGDGGKIRLSAGAPRVVGDDEERMLLALREIVEADLPLPVQVGVNRGPVFTGEVGPAYRRWYAVMGDTVNLAARVMGKAPIGHIYATPDVVRRVEGRFGQVALEPFAVKGKARPIQAWDVGQPVRAASQGTARHKLPLVGRERELEALREAIVAARRGSGTLIELVGETGSGKSRLLAEARELGREMTVLRTTCEVVTRETPYFPWRELLRQLLGVDWDDSEAQVRERLEAEVRRTEPESDAMAAADRDRG